MQGGAWPVCPLMPWHYQYSFTPEWGKALSIWSKGVLNPSYLSFDSGQSQTHNLSQTSQELNEVAWALLITQLECHPVTQLLIDGTFYFKVQNLS